MASNYTHTLKDANVSELPVNSDSPKIESQEEETSFIDMMPEELKTIEDSIRETSSDLQDSRANGENEFKNIKKNTLKYLIDEKLSYLHCFDRKTGVLECMPSYTESRAILSIVKACVRSMDDIVSQYGEDGLDDLSFESVDKAICMERFKFSEKASLNILELHKAINGIYERRCAYDRLKSKKLDELAKCIPIKRSEKHLANVKMEAFRVLGLKGYRDESAAKILCLFKSISSLDQACNFNILVARRAFYIKKFDKGAEKPDHIYVILAIAEIIDTFYENPVKVNYKLNERKLNQRIQELMKKDERMYVAFDFFKYEPDQYRKLFINKACVKKCQALIKFHYMTFMKEMPCDILESFYFSSESVLSLKK